MSSKMLDEIREQPLTLERTLKAELRPMEAFKRLLEKKRPRLIVLAARGTSDNAARFGRYLFSITTGIPVTLAAPSIFTLYNANIDLRDTLVVAISQSGESTDINVVIERAREMGAITAGITNEASSALAKLTDHTLLVRAGREKSVAATKTYTGQLMLMYLLAYALGAPIPVDELRRLPDLAALGLKAESKIAECAERYRFMDHAVVISRGLNYANCFEFSLKLMETCYIVAERFSAADLLHGPIAMVGRSFPAFLFAPSGATWPGIKEVLSRLDQVKAESLLITDRSNSEAISGKWNQIVIPGKLKGRGPHPEELYTPIPYIIPAQLFAAALAETKGIDADHPRTLSKVTRTM
jgi:glucosamine--fructose-6-phosphate aminotransferase (isomerizing)